MSRLVLLPLEEGHALVDLHELAMAQGEEKDGRPRTMIRFKGSILPFWFEISFDEFRKLLEDSPESTDGLLRDRIFAALCDELSNIDCADLGRAAETIVLRISR